MADDTDTDQDEQDEGPPNTVDTAIEHAAAVLLARLKGEGRGWTTLQPNDPALQEATDLAHEECDYRSIDDADRRQISPQLIHARAQQLGAAGGDPHELAARSRAERPQQEEDEEEGVDEANTGTEPAQPLSGRTRRRRREEAQQQEENNQGENQDRPQETF
jgi:hypothetical protein